MACENRCRLPLASGAFQLSPAGPISSFQGVRTVHPPPLMSGLRCATSACPHSHACIPARQRHCVQRCLLPLRQSAGMSPSACVLGFRGASNGGVRGTTRVRSRAYVRPDAFGVSPGRDQSRDTRGLTSKGDLGEHSTPNFWSKRGRRSRGETPVEQ